MNSCTCVSMSELNKKRLRDIALKDGNTVCADCESPDPAWASHSIGVFVCVECASHHRALGTHISKVKSLQLDSWDDAQVLMMQDIGNVVANKKYLQYVPLCYRRPDRCAPPVLREQWIRAKYERLEFQDPERQLYLRETKVGHLWKKGRDDSKFLSRRFELRGRDNLLVYFTKETAKSPKGSISIDTMNCVFVPEKIGNLNGMQITYEVDGATRNLYVYADDGKDIVDWYMAIRNAKLIRLRIGLPTLNESLLVDRLTRDFTMEGWLYKAGPNLRDAWRRRWFTLDKSKLVYLDDPLGAYAKGELIIGLQSQEFDVYEGLTAGRADYLYSFTLCVPGREYALAAESLEDRAQWIAAFKDIITASLPDTASSFQSHQDSLKVYKIKLSGSAM